MLHVVRLGIVLSFIVLAVPAFGIPVVTGLSPTRQVLTPGQGTSLSVTASGSSSLSYQWRHNGRPISGATGNSLSLNGSSNENGWYDAAVSDSDGSTRSPAIFVTIAPTTSRVRTWSYSSTWLPNIGQGDVPTDLNTAIATSVGTHHTVALKRNGTVIGWTNDYYTLSSLAPPDGLADVVAVATGQRYTAALKSDGTLAQWGYGQIHAPAGLTGIVAIAVSNVHGLALKADGTVVAWGYNAEGQSIVPVGLNDVVAIACNSYHSMALKSDGTVVTWGSNYAGALDVPAGLTNVIAIAAGQGHSLALKNDGTVVAWGDNDFGQSDVPSGLNGVVAIAGAVDHSVAVKSDGSVVSWGAGQTSRPSDLSATFAVSAGQQFSIVLSDATTDSTPTIISSPVSQTTAETQSATFSVTAAGPLPYTYQWRKDGVNLAGATTATYSLANITLSDAGDYDVVVTNYLGSTTSAAAHLTVNTSPVVTPVTPASQIVRPGQNLSLGVTATGTGSLNYQWFGNGLAISGATNSTLSRSNVNRQDSGWYVVVVSDSAGSRRSAPFFVTVAPELTQVVAWSSNIHGATTVPAGLNHVLAVAAGTSHAVALKSDGTVVRWGYSQYGLDTMPASLTGVVAITAGPFGVLALKSDGTVTAWGDTGYAISRVPTALNDVVAVAQGYGFSVALRSDGTVLEWGGDSTGVPSDLNGVTSVAAGDGHLLTLKNDGTVLAWGRNDKGQATVATGLSGIKAIAAGHHHSLALKNDGSIVAWGDNSMGQTSIPAGLGSVVAISSRGNHSLALKSNGDVVAWGENIAGQLNVPVGLRDVFAVEAGDGFSLGVREAAIDLTLITKQPQNVTSSETQNAEFTVQTAGGGVFTYQWRKDGVNLPGATSSSLTLAGLTAEKAGNYDVVVSNYLGSVTSAAARLTVNSSPTITALSPRRHVVAAGDRLELDVTANGTGFLSYQWTQNGRAIYGATSSHLTLPIQGLHDGGYYHVYVTDNLGTRRSAAIFVIATSSPVPTRVRSLQPDGFGQFWYPMPADLTDVAAVGAYAAHAVAVRNTGEMVGWGSSTFGEVSSTGDLRDAVAVAVGYQTSYAVKRNGSVAVWGDKFYGQGNVPPGLNDIVAIAGGTSYALALRSNGTVIAWGSNDHGQCDVPVDLADVVAIAASGSFPIALKGDGTVVSWGRDDAFVSSFAATTVPPNLANVVAIGGNGLNSAAVRQDGSVVAWGVGYTQINDVPSEVTNVVAVSVGIDCAIALTRQGTLVAWGRNDQGISLPANLKDVVAISAGGAVSVALQSYPVVTTPPANRTVQPGGSATFSVAVYGAGPFSYSWRRNGVPVPGANAATLVINDANESHAGSYDVVVANSAGSTLSSAGTLVVGSVSSLINIATRAYAGTGNNVTIGGFVVSGNTAKRVLVRAVGPSLTSVGIGASEVLADPVIAVHRGATVLTANDNWKENANAAEITTTAAQIGARPLDPTDTKSAALLLTLEPGVYTFVATGTSGTSGIVLLEVYDAAPSTTTSRFVNIATRAHSTTGNGVTIGGFVISGTASKLVLLRAVGPTLMTQGIGQAEVLVDPMIELHKGAPLINQNDNWGDNANAAAIATTAARIGATPLATTDATSSALLVTLDPGVYSFLARGKSGASGIVLVEVYDAD